MTDKIYTLEEQKENRKLWVEALRSGEYKQGTNKLCTDDEYCCLGVLSEIAGAEKSIEGINTLFDSDSNYPSQRTMDFVGLVSKSGYFDYDKSLSNLNDNGVSFETIADLIESEPEGLFKNE